MDHVEDLHSEDLEDHVEDHHSEDLEDHVEDHHSEDLVDHVENHLVEDLDLDQDHVENLLAQKNAVRKNVIKKKKNLKQKLENQNKKVNLKII